MNHSDVYCRWCGVPAGTQCVNTRTGEPLNYKGMRMHFTRSAYDWVSRKSETLSGELLAAQAESRIPRVLR